ncbi:uncharacterized protein DUF4145 [Luteibacter sp. OK325]|uniref:DUF4145 domain-containing protein n=1 Tax=Luteibacter sp. OK325 TaxID=2135670 RepID=UPI000D360E55|nr:DUF4145 domain-containing protein [Luteibacter sp. OK325]PTR33030.1 uncharacterized protein DUF4145 [Luteibacter sp. OK325]
MNGLPTMLVHCNKCGGETRHSVLHKYASEFEDPETRLREAHNYKMLACRGCESVSLKHSVRYQEEFDGETRYYPPHVYRKPPAWLWRVRDGHGKDGKYVNTLLVQIYEALAVDAFAVAAMGVRALLEYLMVSKVGDQGSFQKNLKAFHEEGHVTARERERLEKTLDVGSAAIHRAYLPEHADAMVLLDIAEHAIVSMYLHDEAVNNVAQKVPVRQARKKPEGAQDQKA